MANTTQRQLTVHVLAQIAGARYDSYERIVEITDDSRPYRSHATHEARTNGYRVVSEPVLGWPGNAIIRFATDDGNEEFALADVPATDDRAEAERRYTINVEWWKED